MRRPRAFKVLSVLSLLLCATCLAMWLRGRRGVDFWSFAVGGRYFQYTADARGLSVRWLAEVPAESMPPPAAMGWQRFVEDRQWKRWDGRPPRGAFLNVPETTLNARRFAGVDWSWGQGQILQPVFFLYRASPMLPLRGVGIEWRFLIACTAVLPIAWMVVYVRRRTEIHQRLRRGLCPVCGYDVRASPERCPECGTSATTA